MYTSIVLIRSRNMYLHYGRLFLSIVLVCVLANVSLFAQETEQQRRDREHQAVINYMNSQLSRSTMAPQPANDSVDKYELRDKITKSMRKSNAFEDRKRYMMNGNNVSVEIWNYGGIGPGFPGRELRDLLGMVWRGAPYIFQFSPIIGASVPSAEDPNKKLRVISDGLYDYENYRSVDPENPEFFWTWEPLPGYADPDQEYIASNPAADSDRDGKPDTWPRDWYHPSLGEYVWPGYLRVGENNADLEVYWAMDDRFNRRHPYYPFVGDSSRKGLGIQIDGRAFQWSNTLAANAVFFVWDITNVSDKDLDSVFFGIYGDPDLGGGSPYNQTDNGYFVPPFNVPGHAPVDDIPGYARSMVYFWDSKGTGRFDVPLGYLGCKFLESPGNPNDGIDNDGDGIIDERQDSGPGILITGQENIRAYVEANYNMELFENYYGLLENRPAYIRGYWWTGDSNLNWDVETDDVGIDGIPGTGAEGEGDGIPTLGRRLPDGRPDPLAPGEPNFGFTDLEEADQIGLTSFNSWTWATDALKNNESIWNRNIPGRPTSFSQIEQNTDIVFVFGSGYISLRRGETKKISMAFILGETLQDLLITAETVQTIYNNNYRFFRPPDLPTVWATPGDKKVTLYWDTAAEESEDPITGDDFEGYVIYRSTRPDFSDILRITDGQGAAYLYEPLRDSQGRIAKWDLDNQWRGYHPVPYQGRGIHYYLGDNTGLVHTYVDSNNVINGQAYYYAVVAYDHGDSVGIPPSETSKKITVDPITGTEIYSSNTIKVIPGPRAAGYTKSSSSVQKVSGYGNGIIDFEIVNDLDVRNETYTIKFSDTLWTDSSWTRQKNYSILGEELVTESFYLFDTKFASLSKEYLIDDGNIIVMDVNGTVYQKDVDYIINFEKGRVRRTHDSSMPNNSEFTISYMHYSVYQSTALTAEDSNPVFDGIKVIVTDYDRLAFDEVNSRWMSNINMPFRFFLRTAGNPFPEPSDYMISFSDQNISTAKKFVPGAGFIDIPVKYKVEDVTTGVPVEVITNLQETVRNDSAWTPGEEMVFYRTGSPGGQGAQISWSLTISRSPDNDALVPGDGDVLMIYTTRPFTSEDVYILQTEPGYIDDNTVASSLDNVYVVPNPYVGASMLEPANKLPGQNRGERRIYFENLPMNCTIRIYTLSGDLVNVLEHDSGMDSGREYWNLLNKDGFSVSYGVYLAHIDAPGVGQKLIKFALIK
jgi:hypothetical protein